MKLIVFGATGTVGKHVVQQALEQGHEVAAFSRNPQNLNLSHPKLKLAKGDVNQLSDCETALKGMEAAIITLGSGKSRKNTVRSVGTQNIIEAMQKQGVDRLICQTTLGCGDSQGNLNFFWKHIMFGWFLKPVFLDHELQESLVSQSRLKWSLVRPSAFTDGERTGRYDHGFKADARGLKLKIARADVADFILKELKTNQYVHQAAGVSY